jgi:3alpha(or 20beta)-hydroxysteroid dehydrogenase
MKTVAPAMIEAGKGSIVNISSVGGMRGGGPCFTYAATKWAVRGMTKGAAQTLAKHGIRVNSIHPGWIDTPMTADFPDMSGSIPLGRSAGPDEVALQALWLASDDSPYSTGAEFIIDGGMTA